MIRLRACWRQSDSGRSGSPYDWGKLHAQRHTANATSFRVRNFPSTHTHTHAKPSRLLRVCRKTSANKTSKWMMMLMMMTRGSRVQQCALSDGSGNRIFFFCIIITRVRLAPNSHADILLNNYLNFPGNVCRREPESVVLSWAETTTSPETTFISISILVGSALCIFCVFTFNRPLVASLLAGVYRNKLDKLGTITVVSIKTRARCVRAPPLIHVYACRCGVTARTHVRINSLRVPQPRTMNTMSEQFK